MVISDQRHAEISQKQDGCNMYVIMKTVCPPGYHHHGFVATHALDHKELPQSHCSDNREGKLFSYIYITDEMKSISPKEKLHASRTLLKNKFSQLCKSYNGPHLWNTIVLS